MAATKTLEQIITDFQHQHGHKYDYSQVQYHNSTTKVTIICPAHGPFQQQPRAHIAGQGCSKCTKPSNWKPGKHTLTDFITKARQIHGTKYDYSQAIYINNASKLTIICKEHGPFIQRANGHLNGQGCPACAKSIKKTTTQFINKLKVIHNDVYDYSKTKYRGLQQPIIIICKLHGGFTQKARNHLNGHGCPACGSIKHNQKNTEQFISKSKAKHGDIYIYDKAVYVNAISPVTITCKKHGDFTQTANAHSRGKGCTQCGLESMKDKLRLTNEEFIAKAQQVHLNIYDYSKTDYTGIRTPVIIICKKHGPFNQRPGDHVNSRNGCPNCAVSLTQRELFDAISKYDGSAIMNDRSAIKPYELDVYSPSHKLAFELNGIYYHSFNTKETTEERLRHAKKHEMCIAAGIKLLQFTDQEWKLKRSLIESMIAHQFGHSNRVHARTCEIITDVPAQFFRDNHMHGFKSASMTFGLKHHSEILMAMSFSVHKQYEWEICRMASKQGYAVVGGAAKLLAAFRRKCNPTSLFSFADRRFSTAGVYLGLGFQCLGVTKPNYGYVKNEIIKSRIACQKHKLSEFLDHFDAKLSESANMFANGWRRLWDAGHYRLLKNF